MKLIGWFAVLLTTIQFLPQVFKAYRTKRVRDISLQTFLMMVMTATTWIIYGVLRMDFTIIAANSLVLISGILIVFAKLTFKE